MPIACRGACLIVNNNNLFPTKCGLEITRLKGDLNFESIFYIPLSTPLKEVTINWYGDLTFPLNKGSYFWASRISGSLNFDVILGSSPQWTTVNLATLQIVRLNKAMKYGRYNHIVIFFLRLKCAKSHTIWTTCLLLLFQSYKQQRTVMKFAAWTACQMPHSRALL